jgi:hypothetical protein
MKTYLVSKEYMDALQADKSYGTAVRVGDALYTTSHYVPYAALSDRLKELSREDAAKLLESSAVVWRSHG